LTQMLKSGRRAVLTPSSGLSLAGERGKEFRGPDYRFGFPSEGKGAIIWGEDTTPSVPLLKGGGSNTRCHCEESAAGG